MTLHSQKGEGRGGWGGGGVGGAGGEGGDIIEEENMEHLVLARLILHLCVCVCMCMCVCVCVCLRHTRSNVTLPAHTDTHTHTHVYYIYVEQYTSSLPNDLWFRVQGGTTWGDLRTSGLSSTALPDEDPWRPGSCMTAARTAGARCWDGLGFWLGFGFRHH